MVSETVTLLSLSATMFIGSYVAGIVPLSMSFSESKLTIVSTFGAGLLTGTALGVIIPEGVNALYKPPPLPINASSRGVKSRHSDGDHHHVDDEHHHNHKGIEPHTVIGLSLVLGFVLMLIVDQSSQMKHNPADIEIGSRGPKITATIGLVVHAAADGVALGAAAVSTHHNVEIIVFFAIMLHKMPAAFALVTFLLHEGLDKNRIRRHLLIFSLAAPVLAITTYAGLSQGAKETMASINATGIALLFSAGTFLYVATVHVLPELSSPHAGSHLPLGDSGNKPPAFTSGGFTRKQLVVLVCGTVLPGFMSIGHSH